LLFSALAFIGVLLSFPAFSQQSASPLPASDKPLEITADQTLEWHRTDLKYIARGNVVAKQGDVEIHADVLTADYRETASSSSDIYRLTADGNVVINSQGSMATGQNAVYDVATGKAIMTGSNLRLTSPDQDVTARDSFEYFVADGRLTAAGDVIVTRPGGDKLRADRASAVFVQDAKGQRQLKELTADGNVVITTATEILRGARGRYEAGSDTAALEGNVRIERGPNILEGDRAEVNLTTNISRMVGAPGSTGRVRGVFYPGSEQKPQ
jgi:lipopolysaccharide export system protein LptA